MTTSGHGKAKLRERAEKSSGKKPRGEDEQFDDDRAELEKFPRNLAAVL
jgi:hypothetical protein